MPSWHEIEEIFHQASLLPAGQRGGFLDVACLDRPELRAEVDSLLAEDVPQDTIGEDAALGQLIGGLSQSIEDSATPKQLGPWRVLQEIGRGGMGAVYLAERADGEFTLKAAIKLVKRGMDTDAILDRFRHERQLLAQLRHPNIARLLDGGAAPDGRPYLVMELIEGQSLNEYVLAHKPTLRARLELFLKICAAVQHAHQNMVIHRDLKSSNILVTADGEPKLLDFGIAKLITPNDSEATLTQARALTPDYASPEQVLGLAITAASDVYSLGILLFELLTGARPYKIAGVTPTEMETIIVKRAPPKPNVNEDLDNIILMALRKEPERRYRSVAALAQDIENYLCNLPVRARADTFRYRASKFLRRNRLPVAISTAAAVALLAATGYSIYQANLARQRFNDVRQLANTFLFAFHDEIAPLQGSTKAREMVVKTALQYLERLAPTAGSDVALQKELAAAYQKVGDAQGVPSRPNLGQTEAAIISYRKAAAIHETIAAKQPSWRRQLGIFDRDFAFLLMRTNHAEEAARVGRAAQQNLEHALRDAATDLQLKRDLARTWCVLGDLDEDRNRFTLALEKFRKCEEIAGEVLAQVRDVDTLMAARAAGARRGTAARSAGHLEESLATFAEDGKLVAELTSREPLNPNHRRSAALLAQFRSSVYDDDDSPSLEDPARCLFYSREYLELARQLAARDPDDSSARLSVAIGLFRLSYPLKHTDPKGAIASARESVRYFDEQIALGQRSYLFLSRRPRAMRRLSEALLFGGQKVEARVRASEAVEAERKFVAKNPQDKQEAGRLALMLVTAAEAADALGDFNAAKAALIEAEGIAVAANAENSQELATVVPLSKIWRALAKHFELTKDEGQMGAWRGRALKLWREFPDRNDYVKRKTAEFEALARVAK